MSNTAWGIISLIGLILNLTLIPGDIAEEKYTSAAFSGIFAIISAMTMVYFFMLSMAN